MDEVRLHPVCDLCDERADAVSRVVVGIATHPPDATHLGRVPLMVVDVCADHLDRADAVSTLAAHGRALARRGTPPALTAAGTRIGRRPGPVPDDLDGHPCPVCGKILCRRNVPNHLVEIHGWKKPKPVKTCPDCGFKTKPGAPWQAMSRHRSVAHGWTMVAAMIEAHT